jgi:ribosomal-protein-alanine N-acetyltransferase
MTKPNIKQNKQKVWLEQIKNIQRNVLPMDETNLENIIYYPNIYHVNIIKKGEKIVGYLVWKENYRFFSKPTAYISSFAILPEYQNKGYGSKLLTFTLNQIRKTTNLKEIEVDTWKTNNKAIRFYLKHGFQITSLENSNITLTYSFLGKHANR